MKRVLSLIFAFLLCASLMAQPAFAAKKEETTESEAEETVSEPEPEPEPEPEMQETFRIFSKEDYLLFASECGIDSWSVNRSVYLLADLDFSGTEFTPVPVFCGTFYGGGHSITGVSITADGSHTGVFRYVAQSGSIKSLKVSGTVTPGGTGVCVGGIAGSNYGMIEGCCFSGTVSAMEQAGGIAGENCESGRILRCSVSGSITGEHMAGGIAGMNAGSIISCSNSGNVNNVRITVSDEFTFDVSAITSTFSSEDFLDITDIGGVAGFSSGTVLSCTNTADIGYNRMGYNVGGIAGRSSGCIRSCENTGEVKGRKDVGGIAGQLEPYTFWSFSKSKLEELDEQIKLLDELTDDALKESDGYNRQMKAALSEFSTDLKNTITQLGPVLDDVEKSADEVSSALDRINEIAGSGDSEGTLPGDITDIIGGMTGEGDPDKLSQISEIVSGIELETPDFDPLVDSLNSAADSGSRLTALFGSYAGELTDNVRKLIDQTNNIYAGFTDTAEYIKNLDGDYASDISAGSIDEYSLGSIGLCSNSAKVSAETNAGGIVGAAAVEFSFDVEDELNISDYLFTDPSYMIYAVIRNCSSFGDVSAVKSCAGGIAGRMDFGAAGFCTAAGEMKVSSGDFCGGITGKSSGVVMSCFSRVQVSGGKYVGGIAGQGCDVKDCRAYAYVDAADEYFGTVAGSAGGECSGNLFVKNGINAIDNISYSGIAEPMEYSEMIQLEDVPDLFREITVTFIVEGECFKAVTVPFGGSISELPAVPEKDGMYWKWDSFDSGRIYYSLEVEGKYCSPITTLTSPEDPPLYLVQGSFYEGQELQVIPYSPDCEKLGFPSNEVLNACTLRVSDCEGVLTFRMRSGEGKLFVLNEDGSYSRLEHQADGSYLVFAAPNGATVALVSGRASVVLPVVIAASASVVAAVAVTLLVRKRKKRKQ